MSNHGPVAGAVGDGEELATVGAFGEDFLEGLEEKPLWETDLSARGGAVAADGCDRDFLGRRKKSRVGEGLEFGGVLGAAEVALNARDFVEVGHARGGVSKIQRFNHNRAPWQAGGRATEGWPEGRDSRERASQRTRRARRGLESGELFKRGLVFPGDI